MREQGFNRFRVAIRELVRGWLELRDGRLQIPSHRLVLCHLSLSEILSGTADVILGLSINGARWASCPHQACAIVGALLPIQILAELTNIGTLSAFVLVSLAVWRLRHTHPELPRKFRTPWVPFIPILSALAAFFLIVQLPVVTMIRFLIWLAIGFVLYFLYGRRHSALREGVPPPPSEVAP
jgi:amino acid transporter